MYILPNARALALARLRGVGNAERLNVGNRTFANERGPVFWHEKGENMRLGVALEGDFEGERVLEKLFEGFAHLGEHRAEGLRGAGGVCWTEPEVLAKRR